MGSWIIQVNTYILRERRYNFEVRRWNSQVSRWHFQVEQGNISRWATDSKSEEMRVLLSHSRSGPVDDNTRFDYEIVRLPYELIASSYRRYRRTGFHFISVGYLCGYYCFAYCICGVMRGGWSPRGGGGGHPGGGGGSLRGRGESSPVVDQWRMKRKNFILDFCFWFIQV